MLSGSVRVTSFSSNDSSWLGKGEIQEGIKYIRFYKKSNEYAKVMQACYLKK